MKDCGLTVTKRCELLNVSRWEAYNEPKTPDPEKTAREEELKARIDYWHTSEPYAGARKIKKHLRAEDYLVGRKLVSRLMSEMGIYAVYPKKNLSKPGKGHKKFPYLLRGLPIWLPNQVWAIDITYIPMKRGHMYLTAIIDWHSRLIVGWTLSDTLEATAVVETVKRAIAQHGVPSIINSDQGSQFTSEIYVELLKTQRIKQSMDGKARWVDNVIIERWFRSLKTENVYINEYATPRELRVGISHYVRDYNEVRPHQALDYETPSRIYHAAFVAEKAA